MSSAAKVGLFMIGILAILGYLVLKIEDIRVTGGAGTRKVTAIFDSVAGLAEKSTVRVAGVPVGKVSAIRLRGDGKAEVTLELSEDVQLHPGARARVANLGLLGEKYIEIEPGNAAAPPLARQENVTIPGTMTPSIDDVTSQVSAIATDVKAITASLRNVIGDESGQQKLQQIVDNVSAITVQVRELIAANRSNVDATMANVRVISEQLRREIPALARSIDSVASQLGGTVGENREDVRHIVEGLRTLSKDLQVTTDNLNAITGQVKSGEGTVGKLIYSDEAHARLNSALASVESGVTELKNTIGRAGRMRLDLGMASSYYAGLNQNQITEEIGGNSRGEVMLRLTPDPERNRFYQVTLADDPKGARRDKVVEEIVTDPATGKSTTTITHTIKYDRNFLLSGQVGWNLDRFGVRLGIIDNTGGGAVDYRMNDRIVLTGEAFDFGRKRDDRPHLRMQGAWFVRKEKTRTPALFFTAGVDNPLNDTAFTFGGGIRWRDDDLKYLLGSVPLK